MKRTIITVAICILWTAANAQNTKHYIFFYDPITSISETNWYETPHGVFFDLTLQYKSLKTANANNDVNMAITHKDLRFIALSVIKNYLYPGLDSKDNALLKQYKFKVIQGTGAVKNKNEPSLQGVASDYARKYNKLLLQKINEKTKH